MAPVGTFNETDDLNKAIKSIVKKVVKEETEVVTKEDAMVIVQAIIPELDRLIAKRVKEHIQFLVDKIQEKFDLEKE